MAGAGSLLLGLFSGFSGSAYAFHDGGVGHCDGCHTMHNSNNGETAAVGGAGSITNGVSSYLTRGSDPSSTCLNCHIGSAGSYHVMTTDGSNVNAGGDFYWLTIDVPKDSGISPSANHGHNIIAADFGLTQDQNLTSAPSDGTVTYQSAWLGCNSCHDPHGKKDNNINPKPIAGSGSYGSPNPDSGNVVMGNYRLLGGINYDGGVQASGIAFTVGDPVAVAKNGSDSNTGHVDYGSGMSEWCANCHSGFTNTSGTIANHRHPASSDAKLGADMAANYNAYIKTGEMTGSAATSFEHLVPFERGVGDAENDGVPDALGTGNDKLSFNNTQGPDSNSNVMCLTCHRAHATPFDNLGRWNFTATFLIEEEANAEAAGFTIKQLYGGDDMVRFGEYQRTLCNKCHVQD